MKHLNKPSDNLGGLLSVWAVPPNDITIGFNTANFRTTANIIEMYCSPGSISFTEKEVQEKYGGKLFLVKIHAIALYVRLVK